MPSILKTIANALFPEPDPRNIALSTSQVGKINQIVNEHTGFEVACRDHRMVDCRQWLGLVMDPNTVEAERIMTEDVFMQAVKEVTGQDIERDNIVHYYPDSAPTPSRFVQPSSPSW